jgi:hypothetical protein
LTTILFGIITLKTEMDEWLEMNNKQRIPRSTNEEGKGRKLG